MTDIVTDVVNSILHHEHEKNPFNQGLLKLFNMSMFGLCTVILGMALMITLSSDSNPAKMMHAHWHLWTLSAISIIFWGVFMWFIYKYELNENDHTQEVIANQTEKRSRKIK